MAATLTDEAREWAKAYIERLLKKWKASDDDRKALLARNTTLKSCAVVRLRRRLVGTLRDTCWQDHRQRPARFSIDSADPGIPWVRLSTTNIADLLNLTHGTVVQILKRTAPHPAFACYKPIIDELPEVTVRRLRDAGSDELPPLTPRPPEV